MAQIPPRVYQSIIEGLKRFETIDSLRRSQFYAEQGEAIESILNHIWQQPCSTATPHLSKFIRAVQWNIERGKHIDAIVDLFNNDPVLSFADIIALNEVDLGMNRTCNRNIAFELGSLLGMHVLFAPEYIELTKGVGEESKLAGDNREALHGNAILSRYPIKSTRLLRLPSCFNTYQFREKRYGDRIALIAEIEQGERSLLVVSTHLEVRNTPACRGRQFLSILDEISPLSQNGAESPHILIAGDLNTGTFKRGRVWHAVFAGLRLLRTEPELMKFALRHPEQKEPLFSLAAERGFRLEEFNDDLATCSTPLTGLDEADYLPYPLRNWVLGRFAAYNHQLDFRLDYFLARGLRSLSRGEIKDEQSNVTSISAQTIQGLTQNGVRISDHDLIVFDFVLSD
jgi:endonuclease/exonuclease/phosphatase family metal-dependent hydrolase